MTETPSFPSGFSPETHGLVLLYHSISEHPPRAPGGTIHNLLPDTLARHVEQAATHFDLVDLETFLQAADRSGMAAVTFDDGYRNVIEQALPVLESLNVRPTLFLNPVTLTGHWNWRDKVRQVIADGQEAAFTESCPLENGGRRFYRTSKDPGNNSARVDHCLDRFLDGKDLDIYPSFPYMLSAELDTGQSTFDVGNHGYHHYVMSSLSADEQDWEIRAAHSFLEHLAPGRVSRCFSAPFGGSPDVNDITLERVLENGYDGILMSRQRLQPGTGSNTPRGGLQVIERFMPRTDDLWTEIRDSAVKN